MAILDFTPISAKQSAAESSQLEARLFRYNVTESVTREAARVSSAAEAVVTRWLKLDLTSIEEN